MNWFDDDEEKLEQIVAIFSHLNNEFSQDFHKEATPFKLCVEIIDKLGKVIEHESDWLVIANLEFVYTVKKYFLHRGWNFDKVSFATPCDTKAEFAKKMGIKNIIKYNYSKIKEWSSEMKFGVIVTNPPYQHPTNKRWKMWVSFIEKSNTCLLNPVNGKMAAVTPFSWVSTDSPELTRARGAIAEMGLYAASDSANAQFNVGEEVGYFITQKGYRGETIIEKQGTVYKFEDYVGEPIREASTDSIIKKLNTEEPKIKTGNLLTDKKWLQTGEMSTEQTPENTVMVMHTAAQIYYIGKKYEDRLGWKVIINLSGYYYKDGGNYMVVTQNMIAGRNATQINCASQQEALNVFSFMKSKLYRFYVESLKSSGFNTPVHNIPMLDSSKSWTDQELYQHFNLTQEEIELVEATIK
jgi:hypothetical protein